MTTAQIAQMVARRTQWKTPSEMPTAEKNVLAVCMSRAMQVWVEKASGPYATAPVSLSFRGQITLAATATNGSTAIVITSPPAWLAAEGIGSTVRLSGDPTWNRLQSLTALRMPYTGPTGAVSITLNHDAAPLSKSSTRIIGQVRLHQQGGGERFLVHREIPMPWLAPGANHCGNPDSFDIESTAPANLVLRVWPAVVTPCAVSFHASSHFTATLTDLTDPTPLPVPDDVATGIIYPLTMLYALREGLLLSTVDGKQIVTDGVEAVDSIHQRSRGHVTTPHMMGTRRGF